MKKKTFLSRKFDVEWIGKEGIGPDTHREYLTEFVNHFYKSVLKLIDRAMRKEVLRGEAGPLLEILSHLHTCINSAKMFLGLSLRPDILFSQSVCHYLLFLILSRSFFDSISIYLVVYDV